MPSLNSYATAGLLDGSDLIAYATAGILGSSGGIRSGHFYPVEPFWQLEGKYDLVREQILTEDKELMELIKKIVRVL